MLDRQRFAWLRLPGGGLPPPRMRSGTGDRNRDDLSADTDFCRTVCSFYFTTRPCGDSSPAAWRSMFKTCSTFLWVWAVCVTTIRPWYSLIDPAPPVSDQRSGSTLVVIRSISRWARISCSVRGLGGASPPKPPGATPPNPPWASKGSAPVAICGSTVLGNSGAAAGAGVVLEGGEGTRGPADGGTGGASRGAEGVVVPGTTGEIGPGGSVLGGAKSCVGATRPGPGTPAPGRKAGRMG